MTYRGIRVIAPVRLNLHTKLKQADNIMLRLLSLQKVPWHPWNRKLHVPQGQSGCFGKLSDTRNSVQWLGHRLNDQRNKVQLVSRKRLFSL